MFGIFKKGKNSIDEDLNFLSFVLQKLPSKYNYLYPQVSNEFILSKEANSFGPEGTFSFTLNAKLEKQFSNVDMPNFFILKDIFMRSLKIDKLVELNLHILQGLLAGMYLPSNYSDLDWETIDISKLKEKHFLNEETVLAERLFKNYSNKVKSLVELRSSFKITHSGIDYYTIRDFKDGNYAAVTLDGSIYLLIHDPFEVVKIFNSLDDLERSIEKEGFDFNVYYNNHIG